MEKPSVRINLYLIACGILVLLGCICLIRMTYIIEIQLDSASDAVSSSYWIKYMLTGTLAFFLLWYLMGLIASIFFGHDLKLVLVKLTLPCAAFLVTVVLSYPAKDYWTAKIALLPLVNGLLSKTRLASAQPDFIFFVSAIFPACCLFLATILYLAKKSNPPQVHRMSRVKMIIALLLVTGAFVWWRVWQYSAFHRSSEQKNILFIICDELLPSHLGCYGYSRNTTPNLDELAEEGVIFANFIAASSWSLPSYISIYTSRYPSYYSDSDAEKTRNQRPPNMAQLLADQNYFIKSLLTNVFAGKPYGNAELQLDAVLNFSDGSKILTDRALQLLRDHKDKQFLIHLQYMDPHEPYSPPEPYDRLFIDTQAPKGKGAGTVDRYDGEIAHLDFQISRLIDKLKELGIYENTYIVLTSDHGEGIDGTSGFHGSSLDNELIRVPLIICGPDIPKNKVIDSLAGHVDLLPTFLEWAAGKSDPRFQGKSLMPLIKGEESESRIVFSELYYPTRAPKYHLVSVQKDNWKLITGGSRGDLLYDVKEDPMEEKNLASREKGVLEDLTAEIEKFRKNIPGKRSSFAYFSYTKEELRVLKSLGYIQ